MISIKDTKFEIGSKIIMNEDKDKVNPLVFTIYDKYFRALTGEWYYKYSYWEDNYEHFYEGTSDFVESLFVEYIAHTYINNEA